MKTTHQITLSFEEAALLREILSIEARRMRDSTEDVEDPTRFKRIKKIQMLACPPVEDEYAYAKAKLARHDI